MSNLNSLKVILVALAMSIAVFSPSRADDTEIFFGQSEDAFETNPNIIFVLDISGSMGADDNTGVSRLNRMKNAMRLLLDQSTNYNVGVMTFNGVSGGAAVRYPVSDLDADSSELCPDGICPDETVFVRPLEDNDDATQNNQSLEVSVNDNYLIMGSVDPATIDGVTGATNTGDTFNDTDTANLTTKTFTATLSAEENRVSNGEIFQWSRQQNTNEWFFENETVQESLFGYQFQNIDIPRNALITSASITFHLNGANQTGDVSAFISGEQTTTPLAFPQVDSGLEENFHTLLDRLDFNNRTNEVVSWDFIPGTTANPADPGNTISTPGMEGILNELINLPSWESGNTMSFIVSPLDNYINSAENVRTIFSAGAVENKRPVLSITYEELEEEEIPVQTVLVDSIQHVDEFKQQNDGEYWRNTTNTITRLYHVGEGQDPRRISLQFPNTTIPKNAIIESAFLTFGVYNDEAPQLSPIEDWKILSDPLSSAVNSNIFRTPTYTPSTTPITLNFNSELSVDSSENFQTPLTDRVQSNDFVSWETSASLANANELTTPNLASVIQNVIDLPEWETGKTVSLIVSPSGNYDDSPENTLHLFTGTSNTKPELEITFSVPEVTAENKAVPHTTAVRFRDVSIPPGATIQSARMIMHASVPNDTAASLSIRGELNPNSQAFTTENNNIGQRNTTTASVTWEPEPWIAAGNDYSSVPITSIIQEITDQGGWCGGNSLSLMISGTQGNRFAQSLESDTVNAPSLEIVYAPNTVSDTGFCSNATLVLSAAQGSDDGVQDIDEGSVVLGDTELSTASSKTVNGNNAIGLRFSGLQIPQGAVITNTAIEFVAAKAMPDGFNMEITSQLTEQAKAYSKTNTQNTIIGRQYGTAIKWERAGSFVTGDSFFTPDLTEQLQSTVNNPSWQSGNAVAFKIDSVAGQLDVVSNDGDESSAPRLIVSYQTLRQSPGTQNRSRIQYIVDELAAVGGTPIVESLYEASQYMRGGEVDYGTVRGNSFFFKRWYRVSHAGSYEGGTVDRDSECQDNDLNNRSCADERIIHSPTQAVYKSPINSQCQSNHIVVLSDGRPTSNTAIGSIESLIGESCDGSVTTNERCGAELATWLRNTDHSSNFPETQSITTHTIGFNIEDPQFLIDMAEAGRGQFEPASSASELLAAFKKIINNVSNRNASFVSPGATVSQFNRLRNSNDVYYAMFQPSGSARWQGNLKRYEVGVTVDDEFGIFDSRGDLAVDSDTGSFNPNSKSFWSKVTDGDNVDFGGAAEQLDLDDYTQRKVYTYNAVYGTTDLTAAVNQFDPSNNLLNKEAFNFPPLIANDPDAVQNIIAWGKGGDVNDENGDGDVQQLRATMGDPMHSVPLVTNYADGESVIYMATNEGFLHALDTDTGDEHFAFIPEALYKNIYRFYQDEATTNRPYGLDGGKTLWHDDTNEDGLINTNETAILYIGMRRGGNSYYALDISDYRNPKYLWSIKGGEISADDGDSTTAQGDYRELASTWSLPVKTKILDYSEVKDVIVFGGGYDQNQDPTSDSIVNGVVQTAADVRTVDSIGRDVFIADAETGELIWQTKRLGDFSDMDYSIPSQVRIIDVNFDGIADQLYVGDMGGQLWRMDFDNNLVSTDSIDQRIRGGKIADIAGDTPQSNRKFYYPPDIAVINLSGEQVLTISIGSGWRAHPLDDVVDDRIYSFRSPHVFGAPVNRFGVIEYTTVMEENSGMIDVTDQLNADVSADALGWYLRFDQEGEKVLGSSLTFNNQLVFTSYLPSDAGFSCDAAIGSGFVYALNIYNGAPILNLDEIGSENDLMDSDRRRALSNPGLPPEVSVLFPETDADSPVSNEPLFQVGKETISELDGGNTSQTTFWQEVSENHDE